MATSAIDLTPAVVPWKVYAGDRNAQQVALFASEGVPWDLTGVEFKAQAREKSIDTNVAIEATVTVDDVTGGIITIAWDGELVRALLAGAESWQGVYDFECLEPGYVLPTTLFGGSFTATLDVTHD